MAFEPVNERPLFPPLIGADGKGVGRWSTSMIRQLTTVFQQYGYRINELSSLSSGVTASRPAVGLRTGLFYFDTTLGKPIWYSGTSWVDATGASV